MFFSVKASSKDLVAVIPRAPIGSLDLDNDADEEQWERDVMALAERRIANSRARLERLHVIDESGDLVDRRLPPDMQPGSETSLETG